MKSLLCLLGFIFFLIAPLVGQNPIIARLKTNLSQLESETLKVDTLNELAYELYVYDSEAALVYAMEAQEISQKLGYKRGIGDSFMRLGSIAEVKGDYSTGADYYRKALAIRRKIGSIYSIVGACNNLGACLLDSGNPDDAILPYEVGLQELEKQHRLQQDDESEYLRLKAKLLNGLGYACLQAGEIRYASTSLQKSIDIRRALKVPIDLAHSLLNAGTCYYQSTLLDAKKSKNYLRQSYTIFKKHNSSVNQAKCLLNLGNLFFQLENMDSAAIYYDKTLEISPLTPIDSVRINSNKASIYLKRGQTKEALRLYTKSLQQLKQLKNGAEMTRLYANLGKVYQERGDAQKAVAYLEKSYQYADSLNLLPLKEQASLSMAMLQELEVTKAKEKNNQLYMGILALWGILGMAVLLLYSNQKKRQIAEKNATLAMQEVDVLLREQELKSAYARLEGQEAERKRVALDLHDRLGVMLSTIKLYFNPIQTKLNQIQKESQTQYQKATALLDEACQEVRRISQDMASPILTNLGLEAELKVLAKRIQEAKEIRINIQTHGMNERLDSSIEIQLYRIIQEIIGNTLKHAKASEINVQLNNFEDVLNVMIEDNGIGFEVEAALSASKGMGLSNIISRVKKLNGTVDIASNLGIGTTISIDIPMEL